MSLSRCARSLTIFCLVAATAYLTGHDIITTNLTYSRDISRIFANRCLACHDAGSSIPLTNYQEVRPWAVGIKEQVLSRSMPPWGAVKGFGELSPDHGLSQEEIMIVAAWVIGGAPEGNPLLRPKALVQSAGWKSPRLEDAVTIVTRGELQARLRVVGIRPITDSMIPSARLVAQLPDGRIQPLLWLYRFGAKSFDSKSIDPRLHNAFTFRKPLDLPKGTIVQSSAPLRFALETEIPKAPSPVS